MKRIKSKFLDGGLSQSQVAFGDSGLSATALRWPKKSVRPGKGEKGTSKGDCQEGKRRAGGGGGKTRRRKDRAVEWSEDRS